MYFPFCFIQTLSQTLLISRLTLLSQIRTGCSLPLINQHFLELQERSISNPKPAASSPSIVAYTHPGFNRNVKISLNDGIHEAYCYKIRKELINFEFTEYVKLNPEYDLALFEVKVTNIWLAVKSTTDQGSVSDDFSQINLDACVDPL